MNKKEKEIIRKEAPKEEIKELKEEKIKESMSSSEKKIQALLDFTHLEELLYLLDILDLKEINLFLEHYKKLDPAQSTDKKMNVIVRNSKNAQNLIENVRNELINSIKDEIASVNERISTLRKKGVDTYVEEMKLYPAQLKIKIFGATSKKEDFYKIKKIISSVEEVIKQKEENFKNKKAEEEKKAMENKESEKADKNVKSPEKNEAK